MERTTTLIICGAIMLLLYIIVLGLIFTDLWAGIRKAKQRGEYRTSEGYKKTIDKIGRYFNMTFAMSLIDIAQLALLYFLHYSYQVDIWMAPWFTIIAVGYVAWVEVHSIWEPADIKEQKQQQEYKRALTMLVKEYGSPEKIIESLKEGSQKHE